VKNDQYEYYTLEEKNYYKRLKSEQQIVISDMESRIKEMNEELIPLRFRIMQSEIDEKICALAIQKLDHLYTLCPSSGEYHKILSWIESICKIPFNVYKALPISRALLPICSAAQPSLEEKKKKEKERKKEGEKEEEKEKEKELEEGEIDLELEKINEEKEIKEKERKEQEEKRRIEIKDFIRDMRATMDENVYGHLKAKDHIIRLLAQWISNPLSKGLVIGIQGSMGTGKTTLIKEAICKTLNLPFAFVPLGGASDAAYLVGHSYTYEGAKWGRIVDVLMQCKCMNPVLFFDELDKVSTGRHGDEIINILIHLTDASQNEHFHDKYFDNLDFDLSRSLMIFSYNVEENINPILRDRMICIHTNGYSAKDKVIIAKNHLIPYLTAEFGFPKDSILFPDDVLHSIISRVEQEEGIRNFRRALHEIFSNVNLKRLIDSPFSSSSSDGNEKEKEKDEEKEKPLLPFTVTDKDVKAFLSSTSSDSKANRNAFMMYV
jgi:ATP-dependent Lon protease